METSIRRAACAILVRRDSTGLLSVYLVRRAEALAFMGGFYAFAGGSVEAVDSRVSVAAPPAPADMCSAALRELFEECGVLAIPGAQQMSSTDRLAMRRAVLADPNAWERCLQHHGLALDGSVLQPCGEWLTPPFMHLRFAAHYFLVEMPADAEVAIWPGELSGGLWITPAEALRQQYADTLYISYPVLETLRAMAANPDDLTAAATALINRPVPAWCGGELLRGIHWVPLRTITLPPATHTNCYVLGQTELVVVDPGSAFSEEQAQLQRYLDSLIAAGATAAVKVREIWLSHHHEDHVGGATVLAERYGVPIAAHGDAAARLHGQVPIHRLLADGETITLDAESALAAQWQVLHTPGHAPGHLCFHEARRGHLLSGDTILGMGTTLVPPSPEGSMRDYMASLQRLQALRLKMLFPGHGPPQASANSHVRTYLQHRGERERAILQAVTEMPRSVPDIVAAVYTDVDPRAHALAALNVEAHLEKLTAEGAVSRRDSLYTALTPASSPSSV